MSVDGRQIAQHVEMQRCLKGVGAAGAQALQRLLLHPPDLDLHFHHLFGELEVEGRCRLYCTQPTDYGSISRYSDVHR